MSKKFPKGTTLICKITYRIEKIRDFDYGKHQIEFKVPFITAPLDNLTGLAIAGNLVQSSRKSLWKMWNDFRNSKEQESDVDGLVILKTEYSTDLDDNQEFVTSFVRECVFSFTGFSEVPKDF